MHIPTLTSSGTRFTAERRRDQAHISGLVHDANAVEVALLKEQQPLQGHNSQARDDPHAVASKGGNASSEGGGDAGGTVNSGGVEGSVGGRTIFSTKSNAYMEPAEPKDDSNFISLDQVFSKCNKAGFPECIPFAFFCWSGYALFSQCGTV